MTYPVKGGAKIFGGGIVAIEGVSGYAVKGAVAAGLVTVGVACETVDNTTGANGAKKVVVEESFEHTDFLFSNDTGTPAAQADVGDNCYIVDDQTVGMNATGASVAGKITEITAEGVWVRIS